MEMKYNLNGDVWEVREEIDGQFWIYKNGYPFETCCGEVFETLSGACYAILNEFSV